jgi:LPXTG-motif cell wall-anchored protein
MKKILLSVAAFIAAAPLVLASGAAFAATTYTPILVKQFNTGGNTDFAVESIVPVNDSVAILELDNGDMWLTDGTTAGTTELETRATADGLDDWCFWNNKWDSCVVSDGAGKLYFWGYGAAEGEWNVWSFDGTAFDQVTTAGFDNWTTLYFLGGELYAWGTTLASSVSYMALNHIETSSGVVDEIIGGNDCNSEVNDNLDGVAFVNDRIIFNNDESDNCDYRLLSWDPANPATAPVDLGTATDAVGDGFDDWESRILFEGELYFSGEHTSNGDELWATNGTVAGTRLVKDINDGPNDSTPGNNSDMWFTEFAGELYFSAYTDADGETFLYKTDGTRVGTVLAEELYSPNDEIEYHAVVLGAKMYFESSDEFYVYDGTTATQLTDVNSDMCYNDCAAAVAFDSHVFFVNYDGTNNSVWVTDGTVAGTYEVTNFGDEYAIADESDFSLVQVGSRLLFNVSDQESDGGTDEIALYSLGEAALADTGANVDGLTLAGLFAVVAGAGVYAVRRRANAKS